MAPRDMRHAVEKVRAGGCRRRPSSPSAARASDTTTWWSTSAAWWRCATSRPVCFDATHAVQHPGGAGTASDGDRRMVAPLARAAVAVGIDALFVEAHPDPERAPCDGPSQIDFEALDALLAAVRPLDAARRGRA